MPEETTAQSEGPDSAPHSPQGNPPSADGSARGARATRVRADAPAATGPARSRRKKILVPTVLGAIGVAVIAVGLWMYPQRHEVSAPSVPTMSIFGSSPYVNDHMQIIYYTVWQDRPGVARVEVDVQLGGSPYVNGGYSVPRGARTTIEFTAGARILACSPNCSLTEGEGVGSTSPLFQHAGSLPPTATAVFDVRARNYQVAANGVTAAVGLPDLVFYGTSQAELELDYRNFPSADSYDWSSLPGEVIHKSDVFWSESVLPGGVTSARVVTGVNQAAQQQDSNFTLAAGVLFGIGGSALVAAAQEALHD